MCVIGKTVLGNTLQPVRSSVTWCHLVWDITSHKIFILIFTIIRTWNLM